MACHHNEVSYHRTQPAAAYFAFGFWCPPANRFLPNHPQDVVGQDSHLQNQSICCELSGGKALHIYVALCLAAELLTFSVGMVVLYDLIIRHTGIRPPGVHFNICWKQELSIFINRAFYDPITGTNCGIFCCTVACLPADSFPIAPNLNGFSFPWGCDILGVFICHVIPILLAFAA